MVEVQGTSDWSHKLTSWGRRSAGANPAFENLFQTDLCTASRERDNEGRYLSQYAVACPVTDQRICLNKHIKLVPGMCHVIWRHSTRKADKPESDSARTWVL